MANKNILKSKPFHSNHSGHIFKEKFIPARVQLCDFANKNNVKVVSISESAGYGKPLELTLFYYDVNNKVQKDGE